MDQSLSLLTMQQVADTLGVDYRTLRRWYRAGRLADAGRIGNAVVFERTEVARLARDLLPEAQARAVLLATAAGVKERTS